MLFHPFVLVRLSSAPLWVVMPERRKEAPLRVRGLPGEIQERARRKLRMINPARIVQDLQIPPGNRLEQMKGDLAGFWSIRINLLARESSVK